MKRVGEVSQRFEAALSWYEKAADSGSIQAKHNLGMMFAEGKVLHRAGFAR